MKWINSVMACALTIASSLSIADVAVIVHPSNGDSIDEEMVAKIYLGKTKTFPSMGTAVPLSLADDESVRKQFYQHILHKTPSQFRSYWSRMIFSGGNVPPKEVESEDKVIALIEKNPNMIGFVSADQVTDDVKVLFRF